MSVEANRLEWVLQNQKTIRAESYQGLSDFVNTRRLRRAVENGNQRRARSLERRNVNPLVNRIQRPSSYDPLNSNSINRPPVVRLEPIEYNGQRVGSRVIVPSSFNGSIRYMQQAYLDAMAIVGKWGQPDLFVTFTFNPEWKELKENIPEYDDPRYRPDIEARVYKLKLAEMLNDIKNRHIFGVTVAHIHVIEFQKRGHPHAHIIITLNQNDKIRGKEMIDKIISAEIPDINTHPRLHRIVERCMLHGPCGLNRLDLACMQNDKRMCDKRFPKAFVSETVDGQDGYPLYRRRSPDQGGKTLQKGNFEYDNRYVVPYNPYLSLKFNAHINVEICSSMRVVKYLYKYVYKGHDRANVCIVDEIENYLDCRYISPPEAMWHLLQFEMQQRSAAVIRLQIHLENQQQVFHQQGNEETALERSGLTMLQGYFELNRQDAIARGMTYREVGEKYVWNKSSHTWTPRKVYLYFLKPFYHLLRQ
jgi:Helitron helicase-like domain at N-terminus